MSNEYKEWKKERSLEAWDDIHKIAEILDNANNLD